MMTKGPEHTVVSATAGTFQPATGNGNQKPFSAKRLKHWEEVAGITGYAAFVSRTALVAQRKEQRDGVPQSPPRCADWLGCSCRTAVLLRYELIQRKIQE